MIARVGCELFEVWHQHNYRIHDGSRDVRARYLAALRCLAQ